MTHHAPTLWSELPLPVREYLILEAPEWIVRVLMHCRCGSRVWIPKPGQVPSSERRTKARIRYREIRAGGLDYWKTIRSLSAEFEANPRTVRRWLRGVGEGDVDT